jgi:hypothetical protein
MSKNANNDMLNEMRNNILIRIDLLKLYFLIYRGVVRIDVKLDELDIDQCAMPFHVANAFKNTDRCDYHSTLVKKYYNDRY